MLVLKQDSNGTGNTADVAMDVSIETIETTPNLLGDKSTTKKPGHTANCGER
jgi:hypothetical protein